MGILKETFNNREIAVGIWLIIIFFIFIFYKPLRENLMNILKILFYKKFIIFYVIFLIFLLFIIWILKYFHFWNISMLKDTIFWVMFVELPIFAKAIEKGNSKYFFFNLLKENFKFIIIIEFLLQYWTFGLIAEILIVPLIFLFGILYYYTAQNKQDKKVKMLLDYIIIFYSIIIIINIIVNIIFNPMEILNIKTLNEFLLPLILFIFNLPIVYGLSLYNIYEQVLIKLKGENSEKQKMKISILSFSGIYLSKISAIHNNLDQIIFNSTNNYELKSNLSKLEQQLDLKIGDNYIKRTNFYIILSTISLLICSVTIFLCGFKSSIESVKEIIKYISSTGLILSIIFLIYSIGLRNKKYEDIYKVKKYSLQEFLLLLEQQYNNLDDYIPLDSPQILFIQYISKAYDLNSVCERVIKLYENLLNTWELEVIKKLNTATL
ncbi:hypothetical protein [Anaerofustis stercorihominis]|uniref:Uncharacterized protein n=1 Tax=Anaerofustis stercorihominis TaxID=214853 RepID=A0A3E3DZ37_9FIRM|nr:hypothetical protein [Anaerofustis stercorihominis]RGD74493.1 hypothetical protein DW687_06975 [Anaerofustis stercorihominis]